MKIVKYPTYYAPASGEVNFQISAEIDELVEIEILAGDDNTLIGKKTFSKRHSLQRQRRWICPPTNRCNPTTPLIHLVRPTYRSIIQNHHSFRKRARIHGGSGW